MDWIEVTARTVEDAKELALDRLGVVEDELEFEVVDQPKRGLFGIARGDARIRARVKPISREKPTDRKRRRRPNERTSRGGQGGGQGGGRGGRGGQGGGRSGGRAAEPSSEDSGRGERSGGPGRGPNPARAQAGDANAARPDGDETLDEGSTARAAGQGGARRRRGGRGRGSGAGPRPEPSGERAPGDRSPNERLRPNDHSNDHDADARDDENARAEVDVETVPVAEQAEEAAKFTDELVRTMGFSATVRTEIDGDDVTVHIEGDGLGALVGPRGVTIQALQEVVRAVIQRSAGGHSAWIHVDVAGYRERRRSALEEFAAQVASEVKDTGEERALESMNAADRKIVHDAISDIDGVDTTSEGEEPRRRVVVFPA
jgi:spoIIIJ-associated protein